MTDTTMPAARFRWQTPAIIMLCGCMIGILSFGPRSGLGFFLSPMSSENGWGRDIFGLALAIQMLLWGAAQPLTGAIADKYGPVPVLSAGAVLYAIGLAVMANSTTPAMLHFSAGILIGFGLAGASFTLVIGAFGKLLPPEWRTIAFGAGTAAGSFGQFLFSPLAVALIGAFGWKETLVIFGAIVLLIIPFSFALSMPNSPASGSAQAAQQQSVTEAFSEALGHRSYVLLVLGFFTCGFQIFFISRALAGVSRRSRASRGSRRLDIGNHRSVQHHRRHRRWLALWNIRQALLLSIIYFGRAVAILVYIMLPPNSVVTLVFGAVLGLLWLSTVPPTSGLVALMFGTRWFTTLFGFAFFSHQVGGFLGVWLGGFLFERTGSYDIVWWLAIFFGVASALINLPIVEKPVKRLAAQPA